MSIRLKRARLTSGAGTGLLVLGLCASAALPLPAGDPPIKPAPAPFVELDRVGGSYVNLATVPSRPMVYDPDATLYAVNHPDSTVECFSGLNPDPLKVFGVPWFPVAIGYWGGNAEKDPEIIVVCAGTWCVVGLDPDTGRIVRCHQLRERGPALPLGMAPRIGRMATPADLLIDDTFDRAFVSCGAADSVIQIDLASDKIVRVFHESVDPAFRCKTPTYMSFDPDNGDVLVAPLHSGNNSKAAGGALSLVTSESVVDMTSWDLNLPDEDLFRIKPWRDPVNQGSVSVVSTGHGAILFAHGVNPVTDAFWQLNTGARNAVPNPQNEPDLKGQFLDNQVTIVPNTTGTWGPPNAPINLDIGGLNGAITAANTVGQPTSIAFHPLGYAFITGLLTDNVIVLDQNGNYHMEFDLPPGSIPRGIVFHPLGQAVAVVHCWGTNKIRAYSVNLTNKTANLRHTYNMNHDPTPGPVAAGREIFYDGFFSDEGNVTCASCHVDYGNDMLVWNLSNHPQEQKGPMFTQLLIGLEKLAPFHWRGERSLRDFNPAFVGLLGSSRELTEQEFDDFEAFVFSLQNPANPNGNRNRLVDPNVHHTPTMFNGPTDPPHLKANHANLTGNAVNGQTEFQDPTVANVANHSCGDCHQYPAGTSNTINVEQEPGTQPRRNAMKPAPFHELWRKKQSLVLVRENPTDLEQVVAFLGSGIAHTGSLADVFRFDDIIIHPGLDQEANNISDLIHQWDQGLGLAAHYAFYLTASTNPLLFTSEVSGYLLGQVANDNCDVAVIGQVLDSGSNLVNRRWAWDRTAGAFVCEDPAFANRTAGAFLSGAANGEANVFLGMPPGMPDRWAIDYDMDGALNMASNEIGFEYDDTVPNIGGGLSPTFTVPPQIAWESPGMARLTFTTSEPTTATISFSEPLTGAQPPVSVNQRSRFHSVLLKDLRPSTSLVYASGLNQETVTYTVNVSVQDLQGNPASAAPVTFNTDTFIEPGGQTGNQVQQKMVREHVVEAICLDGAVGTCDEFSVQPNGFLRFKVDLTTSFVRGMWQQVGGTPPFEPVRAPKRTVVGRVMVRKGGDVETAAFHGLTVVPDAASALEADIIRILKPGVDQTLTGVPSPTGKFLLANVLTDANGQTFIQFDIDPTSGNGLATGDQVIFNVESVIEVDDTAGGNGIVLSGAGPVTATITVFWRGSFTQWIFPDTKEARAAVESKPL